MIVYTSKYCSICLELKEYLSNKGVEFEERVISYSDEKGNAHLMELLAYEGRKTPLIVIGEEVIHGFDKEKIDNQLK